MLNLHDAPGRIAAAAARYAQFARHPGTGSLKFACHPALDAKREGCWGQCRIFTLEQEINAQ